MIEDLYNPYKFPTTQAGRIAQDLAQLKQRGRGRSTASGVVQPGAVVPPYMTVPQVSDLTADFGTMTAGIITGATVRTAASGNRVVIDSTGINAWGSGGSVAKLAFSTSTGDLTITGDLLAGTITGGTISGTAISGGTMSGTVVTGGTVQTAASGNRVVMDSTGIKAWGGGGAVSKLDFSTSTGNLTITGDIQAGAISGGTITGTAFSGGTISGTTVTGGTIQTAASGNRVVIDSTGIKGIAGGINKFVFDTTTGILTATAVISSLSGSVIDTTHLAGTITETQIDDDSISTPKLKANAVEAGNINVSDLASITATLGTITAGTLYGSKISAGSTGTPPGSTGARVELSGTAPIGLKKYDASGNVTVKIGETDGLDILCGTTGTPPNDRQIRWVDGSGSLVSRVAGVDLTLDDALLLHAFGLTSGKRASVELKATDNSGNIAALEVQANPTGTPIQQIYMQVGSLVQRLLGSDGTSDWQQKAEVPVVKPCSGNLTHTNTAQDVAGCTYTTPVSGKWKITAVYDYQVTTAGGLLCIGTAVADGSTLAGTATLGDAIERGTVGQVWMTGQLGSGKVLKLQSRKAINAGASIAAATNTQMIVEGPYA